MRQRFVFESVINVKRADEASERLDLCERIELPVLKVVDGMFGDDKARQRVR